MKPKEMPTQRPKKHYITFRVHADEEMDFLNLRGAIWNSLESWLGEADLAKANVRIISNLWNQKNMTGFMSCVPKYVDSVKMALALVHQVGDQRVIIQVLRVSGTIKSGKEKSGL